MDGLVKSEENRIVPIDYLAVFSIGKLTPNRVMDLRFFDGTMVYEFQKVKVKLVAGISQFYDRQVALITVSRDEKSFKLSYYSDEHGPQIIKDLSVEQLGETVKELSEAGFK